jgi:hypothetical protein
VTWITAISVWFLRSYPRSSAFICGFKDHIGGLGISGSHCIAAWAGAVCLGFALFELFAGTAQAQTFTEFSADSAAGAGPFGITAGRNGNLWLMESGGNRIADYYRQNGHDDHPWQRECISLTVQLHVAPNHLGTYGEG